MSDNEISKNTKITVIVGIFVALVTAAAIFFGLQSREVTLTNTGDTKMTETAKTTETTDTQRTGTVELSIEKLPPADFVQLNQSDPNNPIPAQAYGAYVSNGEVIWYSAGSSSCPPIILSATYNYDSNTVDLTQADYAGKVCTMDLRPLQQRIFMTDGEKIPDDATLNAAKKL